MWRLVEKEWREHRFPLMGMVLLAYVLMGNFVRTGTLSDPAEVLMVSGLVVALLTALLGGSLLAHEKARGTLTLLMVRPIPRWKIWAGKSLFGVTAVLFLSVTLQLPHELVSSWHRGSPAEATWWPLIPLVGFAGLAAGFFFSPLVQRPLTAALLGGAVVVALGGAASAHPFNPPVLAGIAGLALLTGSWFTAMRLLRTRPVSTVWAFGCGSAAASLLALVLIAGAAEEGRRVGVDEVRGIQAVDLSNDGTRLHLAFEVRPDPFDLWRRDPLGRRRAITLEPTPEDRAATLDLRTGATSISPLRFVGGSGVRPLAGREWALVGHPPRGVLDFDRPTTQILDGEDVPRLSTTRPGLLFQADHRWLAMGPGGQVWLIPWSFDDHPRDCALQRCVLRGSSKRAVVGSLVSRDGGVDLTLRGPGLELSRGRVDLSSGSLSELTPPQRGASFVSASPGGDALLWRTADRGYLLTDGEGRELALVPLPYHRYVQSGLRSPQGLEEDHPWSSGWDWSAGGERLLIYWRPLPLVRGSMLRRVAFVLDTGSGERRSVPCEAGALGGLKTAVLCGDDVLWLADTPGGSTRVHADRGGEGCLLDEEVSHGPLLERRTLVLEGARGVLLSFRFRQSAIPSGLSEERLYWADLARKTLDPVAGSGDGRHLYFDVASASPGRSAALIPAALGYPLIFDGRAPGRLRGPGTRGLWGGTGWIDEESLYHVHGREVRKIDRTGRTLGLLFPSAR